MRLFAIGLACTVLAAILVFALGVLVFGPLYLPPHPVVEWLINDQYTLAHAGAFFVDGVAVVASLFVALCIVAPLAPQIATGALWTRSTILFVFAIVAAQPVIFAGLELFFDSRFPRLLDWQTLTIAALLPGFAASGIALVVFRYFAARRRSTQPGRSASDPRAPLVPRHSQF